MQNVSMWCVKGNKIYKEAKETPNSAYVKAARPFTSIQLYGYALNWLYYFFNNYCKGTTTKIHINVSIALTCFLH